MSSRSILHMDPPEHAAFRGLVNRRFTPRAMSGLAGSIRRNASTLLDTVEARGEIDFVAELPAPFPLDRDRGAPGDRRVGPGGLSGLVGCGDRVADRPPAETMAALGQLSGFIVEHIRSSASTRGKTSSRCWSAARSGDVR